MYQDDYNSAVHQSRAVKVEHIADEVFCSLHWCGCAARPADSLVLLTMSPALIIRNERWMRALSVLVKGEV